MEQKEATNDIVSREVFDRVSSALGPNTRQEIVNLAVEQGAEASTARRQYDGLCRLVLNLIGERSYVPELLRGIKISYYDAVMFLIMTEQHRSLCFKDDPEHWGRVARVLNEWLHRKAKHLGVDLGPGIFE